MTWTPISEGELEKNIEAAVARMEPSQRHLWHVIRVRPEKWKQHPYGDEGGGFWVVALLGETAIWYNDIEEGFNLSHWTRYGVIDEYWCNQDKLEWTMQDLLDVFVSGRSRRARLAPPQPT